MCGIAGILHFDNSRQVAPDSLRAMCDSIIHRGPDSDGYYTEENVGLGHRRLSIIDLNTGDQPMFSQERDVSIVFNGEIYNYVELRSELKKKGCTFHTDSDTEVIINAYKIWGVDCQNKFNGMGAFAIWDKSSQKLFLSRDRIGEKPLYYSIIDNTLLFASEIKALIAYGCPKELNHELLDIYLTLGYIPAPYSFYKGISKLEAGHYAIVENGELKLEEYWNIPLVDENEMISDKRLVTETFHSLLKDSVKLRMRSDVSYGAFLSGGLDSSSIVALMSDQVQDPVNTFTIGYDEKEFDESALAKQVSASFNTIHSEKIVTPSGFHESLNKVIDHFDEPFGDSSAIPTGYVAELARDKVKMVLTGDGGDEVLSGYTTYQGEKFAEQYQTLPSPLRLILQTGAKISSSVTRGKLGYKANRIHSVLKSSSLDFQDRLIAKRAWIERDKIKAILEPISGYMPVEDYFSDLMAKCTFKDPFNQLMYFHLKVSLPDDMLVKVDRMTMAHSLEARVPFLDHRLIEYMVGVSKTVKMEGFERKSVLRNAIGSKLPPELLKAPKKGFAVPLRHWFANDALQKELNALQKNDIGMHPGVISELIEDNRNEKFDYGNFIWMLMVLNKSIESN